MRTPFQQPDRDRTRPLHRNQFGPATGGPVILPKYNGRNRTFIFGAYEIALFRRTITRTAQDLSWPSLRNLAVPDDHLTIDDYVFYANRVVVRIAERSSVSDCVGIKDGNIRRHAGAED